MSELDSLIATMAVNAEKASPLKDGDYYDDEGLLCCGKCRTRKEVVLDTPWGEKKVHCLCSCGVEERDREEEKYRRQREEMEIKARKEKCFSHRKQWQHRLENDDGKQPKMNIIREYCIRWSEMKAKNTGLLLVGGVGTGKTFAAECVANRLCETGTQAKMLSLSDALNGICYANDKNGYIRELTEYPLLIIDDFMLERSSEYSLENTLNLIDNRYRSGKPLIITTNLSVSEMKSSQGWTTARICDRIFEMCVPVVFKGEGRRTELGKSKAEALSEVRSIAD